MREKAFCRIYLFSTDVDYNILLKIASKTYKFMLFR